MKHLTQSVLVVFMAFSPLILAAQSATSSSSPQSRYGGYGTYYNDGSNEASSTRRTRIRGYRQQSNGIQQNINTLGGVVEQSVLMPVLFGIRVKDISPNFGDPRSDGRTHEGEDIMAVKGTPIVSPTNAVVIHIGTGTTEGNYVYTANPGGETFVYMHLDKFAEGVTEGMLLNQGALLGYVGNTGNASGGAAHLHFEIHDANHTPINPFPRLTGEFSLAQKISYLSTILNQSSDPLALSLILVTNFRSTFIEAQQQNIILPPAMINALAATAKATVPLVRDLKKGLSGEDVRTLQRILNAHGFVVASVGSGSLGNETIYFGPATLAAVIRFQIAKGISPTAGYVGPLTRAALALL